MRHRQRLNCRALQDRRAIVDRVYARFTGRARQVVVCAQEAAQDLGHGEIGTEHVLLGLIAEREGLAAWALGSLGVDLEQTYVILAQLVASGAGPTVGQIPFTAQAKRVIELANVEVDRRRLNFVGTEHVLLGLLDQLDAEPEGDVALRVLAGQSVTPERVRAAVERFVPVRSGGLSWMLRRHPTGVELHGVQGAGWIDVLSLQPEVHLRRLLFRAAARAMDAERTVVEARDVLAAFSDLPEGVQLLSAAGVTRPATPPLATRSVERNWARIDASEQVLGAVIGAQRRALQDKRDTVTLDDLLLALAVEQASLLSRSGWELNTLRALLESRRERRDAE